MSGSSTTQAGKTASDYELTVVYTPENAENAANISGLVVKTVMAAINVGFTVSSMDIGKVKTLAYPVYSKSGIEEEKGLFVYFELCGQGDVSWLSRILDVETRVLRYLLVRSRNS